MAAIQRQRPHDNEAWALAHHNFGCARETAASLQAGAQVAPTVMQLLLPSQTEIQLRHTCDPPDQGSQLMVKEWCAWSAILLSRYS